MNGFQASKSDFNVFFAVWDAVHGAAWCDSARESASPSWTCKDPHRAIKWYKQKKIHLKT